MNDIDKTARCKHCGRFIEHYAGVPGSEFMTPFWRHTAESGPRPHPAEPEPGSEKETPK